MGTAVKQTLEIRQHRLISDVAAADGGEDAGPTPHELVAAALAACTAETLRLYAKRKGWPLEDADVVVSVDKEGDANVFSRRIALSGALDEAQRQRLRAVADACPVHKLLTGRIETRTELV